MCEHNVPLVRATWFIKVICFNFCIYFFNFIVLHGFFRNVFETAVGIFKRRIIIFSVLEYIFFETGSY